MQQIFQPGPFPVQLPHSVSAIASIESTLGLPEVQELRLPGGGRAPDGWRASLIEQAQEFRAKYPPENEARLYIGQALDNLDMLEHIGDLTEQAQKLRQHVREAVAALDGDRPDRMSMALHHLREGDRSIERELSEKPPVANVALDLCGRAAFCLEMAAENERAKPTENSFDQALKKAALHEAEREPRREQDRERDK